MPLPLMIMHLMKIDKTFGLTSVDQCLKKKYTIRWTLSQDKHIICISLISWEDQILLTWMKNIEFLEERLMEPGQCSERFISTNLKEFWKRKKRRQLEKERKEKVKITGLAKKPSAADLIP